LIASYDKIGADLKDHIKNANDFFNLAVRYPRGLVRAHIGETIYIDRT